MASGRVAALARRWRVRLRRREVERLQALGRRTRLVAPARRPLPRQRWF